jgi:ABC-type transport system substrate-binding protein
VPSTYLRDTQQQWRDAEYIATVPAFLTVGSANDVVPLRNLFGSQARMPSNHFRVSGTGNRSRYINAEFDALLTRYYSAVPTRERTQVLGEIIRHMSDQLPLIGLYYNPRPGAVANRVLNVSDEWPAPYITWNAYEWDVRN